MNIDLHIHSYYSCDGEYSPQDLIAMGANKGIKYISITDHNTVEGLDEAIEFAKEYGINVIPGIEIDSLFENKIIHILGYYLNWKNNELNELTMFIKKEQVKLIHLTVERLNMLGIQVDYKDVLKHSNNRSIPCYASVVEAILDNPYNYKHHLLKPLIDKRNNSGETKKGVKPVFSIQQALMSPGRPAYVENKNYPAAKIVIDEIKKLNGVPILAHPGLYFSPEKERDINRIKVLKSYGIKGMESYSSYHSDKENIQFYRLCKGLKMIYTTGSDFHGKLKPDIVMGTEPVNSTEIIRVLRKEKV